MDGLGSIEELALTLTLITSFDVDSDSSGDCGIIYVPRTSFNSWALTLEILSSSLVLTVVGKNTRHRDACPELSLTKNRYTKTVF